MSNLKTTKAMVIRKIDYGESDQILGLLTQEGEKISVFAKSAKRSQKRFGSAGLDLFCYFNADLVSPRNNSTLWKLQKIDLIDPFIGLRNSLRSLSVASYLAECLWSLIGVEDPHEGLFPWWMETIGRLNTGETADFLKLDLELLSMCGYGLSWDHCVDCNAVLDVGKAFFPFDKGGVVCSGCRKAGMGEWIKTHWVSKIMKGETLDPQEKNEFQKALDGFVTFTIGREPKSQKFREDVLNG